MNYFFTSRGKNNLKVIKTNLDNENIYVTCVCIINNLK